MKDEALSTYLKEIAELPTLSPEEEKELIKKIRLGDYKAREQLVTMHLKSVVSIAKLYQRRGVPLGDLINEGSLGILRALKTYDPERGVRFMSYASWWIRQRMLKIIYQQTKAVKVPTHKLVSKKAMIEIENELSQKLERLPNTEEIAKALGISAHEVDQAIEVFQNDLSLDAQMGEKDVSLLDFLEASPEKVEDYMIKGLLEGELCEKLNELSKRERSVIKLYFGLNGKRPHTLEEIGKKFDRSRERIRQIKEMALGKLRAKTK